MATYLLTWNPEKALFGPSDLPELVDDFHAGERPITDWSCGNTKRIEEGDRVWHLRQGKEPRGLFAWGTVVTPPWEEEHWGDPTRTSQYIEYQIDWIVNPGTDPNQIIPRARLDDPPFASMHWETQRSGILIPDDVANELHQEWLRLIATSRLLAAIDLDLVTPSGDVAGSYTITVPAAEEERIRAELDTHPTAAEEGILDGYADHLGYDLDQEEWEGWTWRPRQKTEERDAGGQLKEAQRESRPAEERPEQGKGENGFSLPEEIPDTFFEGARQPVTINRYERSSRARTECIARHGARCFVCGFAFAEKYGPAGDGLIHVHHLVPLSEIGEGYELDPIEDLRPVCPNCHAMIHARKPQYSIEEVERIIVS